MSVDFGNAYQQYGYGLQTGYSPTVQMSNLQTNLQSTNLIAMNGGGQFQGQFQGQGYGELQYGQALAYGNTQVEYGQTLAYGNQQIEYVQHAYAVPETQMQMQMVSMPVQEMQMVQMPVQEVQMQMVQMPVQEVHMVQVMPAPEVQTLVYAMSPPPLKYETPEPERAPPPPPPPPPRPPSPERERERAAPSTPPPREQRIEYVDHEVLIEVPVPRRVVKNVEVFQERVVEEIVNVEVDVPKYKEHKIVEELLEIDKPIVKEVFVERLIEREVPEIVEVINEVEKVVYVDRILHKEVPVFVPIYKVARERAQAPEPPPPPPNVIVKEVLVEVLRPVMIERVVDFPHDRVVQVPRDKYVEVPRERTVEVPVEVLRDRVVEVPMERIIDVPVERYVDVPVERIVERVVEVPYDRVVDRTVEVPIERIVERVVEVPYSGRSVERATYVEPAPVPASHTVGVGLSLERRDDDDTTFVERIVPGFAAERSGQFALGDEVLAVDDTSVQGWPLDAIKNLTIGREGSQVTMHMLRRSNQQPYSVTVQRRLPDFTNQDNAEAQDFLVDR